MQRELAAAQGTELDDGDSDVLNQAMEDGEAIALSYLGSRYPTQCAAGTASNEVRRIAADLALNELGKRRVGFAHVFHGRGLAAVLSLKDIARPDAWKGIYEWDLAQGTASPLQLLNQNRPELPVAMWDESLDDVTPGGSI